jgi:hypothetical protein
MIDRTDLHWLDHLTTRSSKPYDIDEKVDRLFINKTLETKTPIISKRQHIRRTKPQKKIQWSKIFLPLFAIALVIGLMAANLPIFYGGGDFDISISIGPADVVEGDLVFINATIPTQYNITKVWADMAVVETINLTLIDNTTIDQFWQGTWILHNLSAGDHIVNISAVDQLNTSYYTLYQWNIASNVSDNESVEDDTGGNVSQNITTGNDTRGDNESVEDDVGGNVSQNVTIRNDTLRLDIWADKKVYNVNTTIALHGLVYRNDSLLNASVNISVLGPDINLTCVVNASNGTFNYSMIPELPGEYVFIVNVTVGNSTMQDTLNVTVRSKAAEDSVSIVDPREEHLYIVPGTRFSVERTVEGPHDTEVIFVPLFSDALTLDYIEIFEDNKTTKQQKKVDSTATYLYTADKAKSITEQKIDNLRQTLPSHIRELDQVAYSNSFELHSPRTVRIWFKAPSYEDIQSGAKPSSGHISYLVFTNDDNMSNISYDYESSTWWSSSWGYRKLITVNSSQVDADLTNFPILVSITNDEDLAAYTQDDADDIAFVLYSDNSTQLNHEIEYYYVDVVVEPINADLVAWVNITSLSSSVDTKIWMYYNNSVCSSQENIAGTWDSNYMMVQHLNESSGTLYDSTSNGNNGTNNDATYNASSKIDGGYDFDGNNDYINVSDSGTSLDFDDRGTYTWSMWVKLEEIDTEQYLLKKESQPALIALGYFIVVKSDNTVSLAKGNPMGSSLLYQVTTTKTLNADQFYHIAVTFNTESTVKIYIDGVENVSDSSAFDDDTNTDIYIGATDSNALNGTLDEVRVSNTIRNASWISTSYNNVNDTSAFLSFGSGESQPPYVENVSITSDYNFTLDNLTGSGDYYDNNSDPESGSTYQWWTNESGSWQSMSGQTSKILDSNYTNESAWYKFEYTPCDGSSYGDPVNSSAFQVKPLSEAAGTYSGSYDEYEDLTIANGGSLTISGTIDIDGDVLIQNGGTLNLGSNNQYLGSLTVNAGGSCTGSSGTIFITSETSGGYAVNLDGSYAPNSGILEINTDDNTWIDPSGAGNPDHFNNVVIDLASTSDDVFLASAFPTDGYLIIDDGELDTNNNAVIISGDLWVQSGGNFDGAGDTADHIFGALDLDTGGLFSGAQNSKITITDKTATGYAVEIAGTYSANSNTIEIRTPSSTKVDFMAPFSLNTVYDIIINTGDVVEWVDATIIDNDLTVREGSTFQPDINTYALTVGGDVTLMDSGTLSADGGSAAWSFGSLTIVDTTETLEATSGTITITSYNEESKYIVDLDGTFKDNSGTLRFTLDEKAEVKADLIPFKSFVYDLTIDLGDTAVASWEGSTTINNDLTVNKGTFRPDAAEDTLTVVGDVSVTGGVLGRDDIEIVAGWQFLSLTQTGGTIDATSGTISITGKTGGFPGYAVDLDGTYDHNSGTIEINTDSINPYLDLLAGIGTVNNVIIDLSLTTYDAYLDANLAIDGYLWIDDGELNTLNRVVTVTGELWIQNGGEFDGAGDTVDHSFGALDLDGGGVFLGSANSDIRITSESGTYAVDLDGTYTANSNTLEIRTNTNTEADLIPLTGAVYDLVINTQGNDYNVDWESATTISNDLTISSGVFRPNATGDTLTVTNDVSLSGSGSTLGGNGASGDWTFASLTASGDATIITATSGTINITSENGAGYAVDLDSTYTHNSGTLEIYRGAVEDSTVIDIAPSSGTIYNLVIDTTANTVTSDAPATVSNNVTVDSGIFDMTANLTVNGMAIDSGTTFDIKDNSTFTMNDILTLNGDFKIINGSAIDVNLSSNKFNLTDGINVALNTIPNIPSDPTDLYNVSRYVNLTSFGSSSTVDINISYSDSDLGSIMEDTLVMYEYNESTQLWTPAPNSSVNVTTNYVWANGVTNFSIYSPMGELNTPPEISNENPENESVNVSLYPTHNITVSDADGHDMGITFSSNASGSWSSFGSISLGGGNTFGYTSSTSNSYVNDVIRGSWFTCPANGTVDHIKTFGMPGFLKHMKAAIYYKSNNTLLAESQENYYPGLPPEPVTLTFDFTTPPYLIGGEEYYVLIWSDGNAYICYDSHPAANRSIYVSKSYGAWDDPLSGITYDTGKIFRIWAEYTTSSVPNGTYYMDHFDVDEFGTTYWWNVSAGDGIDTNDSDIFHFSTEVINTSVDTIIPYNVTSFPLTINATAQHSNYDNVTLWYRNSTDNASWNNTYEYYNTGDDSVSADIYGDNWIAQGITIGSSGPNENFTISKVKLKLYRNGSPGTINIDIYDALIPLGNIVSAGTIDGDTLTTATSGDWYTINMGPFIMETSTDYYIVVKALSGDGSNYIIWRSDGSSPTYGGGSYLGSSNGGDSWFATGGKDLMFEVWGDFHEWNDASNPDTDSPWSWEFDFPNGTGYYEFYSIGKKSGSTDETPPASADAMCHYLENTSINVTPSQWNIGTIDIGDTNATTGFYFNLTNEGNVALDITINATNATNSTSGAKWRLNTTQGHDNFSLQYNLSGAGTWTNINITFDTFVTDLAIDSWQTFDLKLLMATTSSTVDPMEVTVTFKSVAS